MESEQQTPPSSEKTELDKNIQLTHIVYGLQVLSLVLGFTAIVGVIINYVMMDKVRGTYLESHFRWQIKTFWITLGTFILGTILTIIFVGIIILFCLAIWYIYRIAKGWVSLNDRKPVH